MHYYIVKKLGQLTNKLAVTSVPSREESRSLMATGASKFLN